MEQERERARGELEKSEEITIEDYKKLFGEENWVSETQ